MRTELSPPIWPPRRLVAGPTVLLIVPNPGSVAGSLGIPALALPGNPNAPLGRPKFGWLNRLYACISKRSLSDSLIGKRLVSEKLRPDELRRPVSVPPGVSLLAICRGDGWIAGSRSRIHDGLKSVRI